MDKAVTRLNEAIENGEHIVVFDLMPMASLQRH
jgi:hypothetical protein